MAGVTPHPTRLPNREAQSHFDRKVLRPTFAWQDSTAEEHAIAFTVAKMMDEDMLAETQKALQDALAQGTDFATFKARLKPYLMARGWWGKQLMGDPQDGEIKLVQLGSTRRLRTIYHTNLHSAYAAGQWARIERNKKAFPYLKYIPSDAAFPREEHRRFYGMILPVDDPFWQTHMPPNGWGCRCNVRALTRAQAEKEGISPSPQLEDVEHINTRTGEVEHYPEGVDPSFAHNPGDRLGALLQLAEEKHGAPFAEKLLEELAGLHMQRAVALPLETASRIVSRAMANESFRELVKAPFNRLLDTLIAGGHAPRTLLNIGVIPPDILQAMRRENLPLPQTSVIAVTEERLKHAAGDKGGKKAGKKALGYEDLRTLLDILREPYAVYAAPADGKGKDALVFVYRGAEDAEKYIVTIDYKAQALRPGAQNSKDWETVVANVFNTAAKSGRHQWTEFGKLRPLYEAEKAWWR